MDNDSFFEGMQDDRAADKQQVDAAEHLIRLKKQTGLLPDHDAELEKEAMSPEAAARRAYAGAQQRIAAGKGESALRSISRLREKARMTSPSANPHHNMHTKYQAAFEGGHEAAMDRLRQFRGAKKKGPVVEVLKKPGVAKPTPTPAVQVRKGTGKKSEPKKSPAPKAEAAPASEKPRVSRSKPAPASPHGGGGGGGGGGSSPEKTSKGLSTGAQVGIGAGLGATALGAGYLTSKYNDRQFASNHQEKTARVFGEQSPDEIRHAAIPYAHRKKALMDYGKKKALEEETGYGKSMGVGGLVGAGIGALAGSGGGAHGAGVGALAGGGLGALTGALAAAVDKRNVSEAKHLMKTRGNEAAVAKAVHRSILNHEATERSLHHLDHSLNRPIEHHSHYHKYAEFALSPGLPEAQRGDSAPRVHDHEGNRQVRWDGRKGYNYTALHHGGKHHVLVDHHSSGRVGHMIMNPESGAVEHSEVHPSHKHMTPVFHERANLMRSHLGTGSPIEKISGELVELAKRIERTPKGMASSATMSKVKGKPESPHHAPTHHAPMHHPSHVAKTAAAADLLSNPTALMAAMGGVLGTGGMLYKTWPRKSKGNRSRGESAAESTIRGEDPREDGALDNLGRKVNRGKLKVETLMRKNPVKSSVLVGGTIGAITGARVAKALGAGK